MRLPAAVRTVPARRRAAAPSERAPRWPLPPSGHAAAPPPLAISFPWARVGGVGGGEDEHRPAGQRSPHRSGRGRPCGYAAARHVAPRGAGSPARGPGSGVASPEEVLLRGKLDSGPPGVAAGVRLLSGTPGLI